VVVGYLLLQDGDVRVLKIDVLVAVVRRDLEMGMDVALVDLALL
jgi:hypothetical protein